MTPAPARRRGPAWLAALPRPIRSGHRGAAGLAPPNTLASFERALEFGCTLLEMDVQRAADESIVLFHDDQMTVDGVRYPFGSLTPVELRALPGGANLATLEEALARIGGRAAPLLDLKGVGFEQQLADTVRAAGVERSLVCGKPLASLLATQAANPAIATSLTFDADALAALDAAAVARIPTDAVTVDHRRLSPELLDWFHGQRITVIAWTVDLPERMRELIALGVDGITTNRPDLLAEVAEG